MVSLLAKILRQLSTTPQRKALVNKALPELESLIKQENPTRVYLHGSFVTPKPDPKDLDVIFKFKKQEYKTPLSTALMRTPNIHAVPYRPVVGPHGAEVLEKVKGTDKLYKYDIDEWNQLQWEHLRNMVVAGNEKYPNDNYKWIRLLGLSPFLFSKEEENGY